MSLLLVGIRSPDQAANERYAEMLTQKLRALPGHVGPLATYNVRDVQDFFEKNKWLYVAEDDLESIRDRLRTEISKRKNPLFVSLGDDEPIDSMQKRIGKRNALDERFPGGLFTSDSGDYIWVAALPPGGLFVEHAGESLLRRGPASSSPRTRPTPFHPEMRAEVAGPVATAIASRAGDRERHQVGHRCLPDAGRAVDRPLLPQAPRDPPDRRPGGHRRDRGVRGRRPGVRLPQLVDGVPGVDHPRQRHQLRDRADVALRGAAGARRRSVGGACARRCTGCWRGTLVAAISASAAYASLMVTSFRGFYQFGVMGAVGAIACWVATFTVLPAILILLDIRSNAGARPGSQRRARR